MSNPKIRIEADLSDVYKDLDKLAAKADQLFKNTGRQDLGGQASALRSLLDQVGKAADKIQDMGGKGISTQGLDGISKKFHEIGTAAQKVEKRVSGKSDWSSWISTFSDELKQASKAEKDLTHLQDILSRHRIRSTREEAKEYAKSWESIRTKFSGTRFAKSSLEDVVESRRSKARSEILQELGLERKRHIENLRKVALPGSAFGVVRNAAEGAAGAEAGAFSLGGIARFAGWGAAGALGLGALGLVRSGFRQFGSVQDEAIGYTDLRKSMGLMASDFDVLRASVRAASDGFGLAYNESQRLAEQFVRSSGVISGASSVAEGVRLSAGFGRGYGINPALSTQFFGTAGRFGGQDNRRLALMIGEAVGKSQLSSKMPEVLSSLSSYLSTAATASLSSPNAAGFLSMLASMSTSGITGLAGNPGGSASIISQVDASIRQGGSAGEASKNFLLGLYSNIAPGFNAFDMGLLNAQGAFGTFKGAFGKDSAAYKMAASRGDKDLMRQYESMSRTPGTVLDLQMQGLVAEYGGSTRGLMKAVSGMYGLTDPQASALIEASRRKGGFGGLKNILELSGIDTRSMSMKDVGRLADLAYGDSAKIESQRRKLLSMDLSSGDERMLASVVGEEEKRRLTLRLTDKYDSKDPGDRAREAQIEMANEMQKLVTGLLPAVLTIKEGIVDIVRFFSDKFGYKSKLIEDLDREKKNKSKVENKKTTPSYPAGFLDDLSFNGNMRMDTVPGSPAKGKVGMQKRREILNRVAARHNFSPKLLEYALTHERSGPYDKSPAGAVGEFQIMPDNFKEYGLDPHDFGQSAEMAARVIDDAIRRYGDNPAAIMAHYNGGWKQGDRVAAGMLPSNEETRRYIDPILRKKALNNTINMKGSSEIRVVLQDRNGEEHPPILINQNLAPVPPGME